MTKEQILACWGEEIKPYCHPEVEISEDNKRVSVTVMYEHLPLSMDILVKLANVFGTDNFIINNSHSDGCETCDWGSQYTQEFEIRS